MDAYNEKENLESKESAAKENKLEILWQHGGNGDYLDPTIEKMKKVFPNVNVEVVYDNKVHDKIKPRLVAGNPPDIFLAHQSFFNHYSAIMDNQLMPVDDVLDSRMPDSGILLKDIFQDNILNLGFVNGKHYLLPDQQYVNGFWYSKKLFKEKNWQVPATWEEFIAFCENVKHTSDISPFAYAGLNAPFYLSDSFIMPGIAALGGIQAINDINDLKPGAWKSEAVIETLNKIKLLVDKGYMYQNSLSIDHSKSQQLFIDYKIAFLPVGSWLENAEKPKWPEDFGLTAIIPPLGDESSRYMVAYNTLIAIPQKAKNPVMAKEFLKLFYTKDVMEKVARNYGSLFPVKSNIGSARGVLSESVVQIFNLANNKDVQIINHPWTYWYKSLDKKYQDMITSLVAGDITPKKFAEEMEKEAENIRNDSSIFKYTIN
jgi:ABC-type sugar transport system, periplasmic component